MNPFLPHRELLVFDLDGTLLDSLEGIANSVNTVRERHGYATIPQNAVRSAIGDGAPVLVRRTMGDILDRGVALDPLFEEFRSIYREESVREPRFYPGGREFLEATRDHQQLAVLTNKPLSITEPMLDALDATDFFVRILAPENARARKPDPGGLLGLLEDLDLTGEAALMFGDSINDFAAGRGAGVTTVGMREGYYNPGEPEPDFWADDFASLLGLWRASRVK